jgi:hypothetical protein
MAPIKPIADEDSLSKPRGRPRIWESEAERKRAYRERKAAELANPERLRAELRNERRRVAYRDLQLAGVRAELNRAVAQLEASARLHERLEAKIGALRVEVDEWRSRTKELARYRADAANRAPSGQQ